jgi:hypothetical protein
VLSRFNHSKLRVAFIGGFRGLFSIEYIVDLTKEPDGSKVRLAALFRGVYASPFFPFFAGFLEEGQKQFLADLATRAEQLKQTSN